MMPFLKDSCATLYQREYYGGYVPEYSTFARLQSAATMGDEEQSKGSIVCMTYGPPCGAARPAVWLFARPGAAIIFLYRTLHDKFYLEIKAEMVTNFTILRSDWIVPRN
jgi:hypothetical protein